MLAVWWWDVLSLRRPVSMQSLADRVRVRLTESGSMAEGRSNAAAM